MITVNLSEMPEDGIQISGQTEQDIFELDPADKEVSVAGPLEYDLHVSDVGGDLLLAQGQLVAPFTLRCVACLEDFPFTLYLEPYAADFDRPASGVLDLTERIREDILLELPGYPHCDRENDDTEHTCPAAGRYSIADKDTPGNAEDPGQGPSAWDALDGLPKKDS
ncbi:MAG: hypothetical protein KDN20_20110 [Verrucomicrobiae bacterium]|nr:hypothetical protein [Verrucomicrobiae bacterium]